jgi:hypothetical protein
MPDKRSDSALLHIHRHVRQNLPLPEAQGQGDGGQRLHRHVHASPDTCVHAAAGCHRGQDSLLDTQDDQHLNSGKTDAEHESSITLPLLIRRTEHRA